MIGLAAAFIVWRILATNIPDLLVQSEEPDAAAHALRWNASRADALSLEALRITKENPEQSLRLFKSAVRRNPTDGPNYAAIARLHEAAGDLKAAERQSRLQPGWRRSASMCNMKLRSFWMRRGDLTEE